jgi:heat shock protein HslJ
VAVVVLAGAVGVGLGVAHREAVPATATTVEGLTGVVWKLSSVSDAKGTSPVPAKDRSTLRFPGDGTALASIACNGAGGKAVITTDPPTITISELLVTRVGCPAVDGRVEEVTQTVFRSPMTWTLQDGTLVLRTASGATLTYVPQPPPLKSELVGITWRLDGTGVVGNVWGTVGSDRSTLRIDEDGTVRAVMACNTVTGIAVVTTTPAEVSFSALTGTDVACTGAEKAISDALTKAFAQPLAWRVVDDVLTLTTAKGDLLQYER